MSRKSMGARGARSPSLDNGNFAIVGSEMLDGWLEHRFHVAGNKHTGKTTHVTQVGARPEGEVSEHGAGQKAGEADQQDDHRAVAGVQRGEDGRQADAEQDEDDHQGLGAVVHHVANDAIRCSASSATSPSIRPPVAKKHLSEGFSDEARRKQQIHTGVTPRATKIQCQPVKCTQYAEHGHENGAQSAEQEAHITSEKLVEKQTRNHSSSSVKHPQLMRC
eukprot:GHVL01017833.1.p2 GENE.GHVL01017833.1~~GHVL01017833.1.p2  ORF type:complete len:220 (+),score=29.18 GHVL01017833.1:163-822(+)